jgi:hypothetical protein
MQTVDRTRAPTIGRLSIGLWGAPRALDHAVANNVALYGPAEGLLGWAAWKLRARIVLGLRPPRHL